MSKRNQLLTVIMILEGIVILVGLGLVLYLSFDPQLGQLDTSQPDAPQKEKAEALIVETEFPLDGDMVEGVINTPTISSPRKILPSTTITPTIQVEPKPYIHIVRKGETLSVIALNYDVSIAEIMEKNLWIENPNMILPGDKIRIPGRSGESADLVLVNEGDPKPYTALPSIITAETSLRKNAYPLMGYAAEGQLVLHYQPGAFVDQNETEIQDILTEAYHFVEGIMGSAFDNPLDLYLAGSLFQDQENLRGFTQSGLYRSYLLVDGTGTISEQTYLFAHEFTHIFAFHNWGRFHSPMIHEGLATYLPQQFLKERTGYLPLDEICAAIKAADHLVPMTTLVSQNSYGPPYFEGHIRSFLYYNQSACFVKYLLTAYGMGPFAEVFHTGNYVEVYGQSLGELDLHFQVSLEGIQLSIDPLYFVSTIESVAAAYEDYFDRVFGGNHINFQAYMTLDKARLAVNSGELEQADQLINNYYQLMEDGFP